MRSGSEISSVSAMNRTISIVTVTTVALAVSQFVAPIAAHAIGPAPRYASPTGSDSATCAQTDPCSITTAINSAPFDGTTIHLAAGSYGSKAAPLTTQLETLDGTTVLGAPDGASVIYTAPTGGGEGLYMPDGGNVSNITLISTTDDSTGLDVEGGAVATHVAVIDTGTGTDAFSAFGACAVYGSSLVDSLCVELGATPDNAALFDVSSFSYTATLTNDTLIDNAPGGFGIANGEGGTGAVASVTATNTIASGKAGDIYNYAQPTATATVSVSHCDFVTTATGKEGGIESVVQTGPNVHTAPKFVAAATGNYREALTSPTIDAGLAETGTDLAGLARKIGPATDIGAYEFAGAKPVVGTIHVGHRTKQTVKIAITINAEDLATTAQAVATRHGKHKTSNKVSLTAVHTAKTVHFTLKHLKPHTSYRISVKAKNSDGTTTSKAKKVSTKH